MDMAKLFKVHFLCSNVHSCFFYLREAEPKSEKFSKRAIKIEFGADNKNTTFGCISQTSLAEVPDGYIGVSSLFGHKLGLKENEVVAVTYCNVDSIDALEIIPKKEEDYVILLSCKSILETYLLNQVLVVAEGQILPVYVFSNISIDIEIGKLNLPSGYGQLEKFTKVTVLHPLENKKNAPTPKQGEADNQKEKLLKVIFNNLSQNLNRKTGIFDIDRQRSQDLLLKNLINNNEKNNEKLEFTVQPSLMLHNVLPKKIQETHIIISNFEIKNNFGPYNVKMFASVQKSLNEFGEEFENSDNAKDSFSLNAGVISLNNNSNNVAFCPPFVMKKLKLFAGSKITIQQIKLSEKPKINQLTSVNKKLEVPGTFWKSMAEIRENVKQTILNNIIHNYKINSLILGESGTGKTFLLTDIVNEFMNEFIYCKVIQCKSLRGKKTEKLFQYFTDKVWECTCQEPSLLVLEDLHVLTYIDEGEDQFNRLYSNEVVDLISNVVKDFQRQHNITVIASAATLTQLNTFVSSHGCRLFQNVLHIPEMSVNDRKFCLKNLIKNKAGIPENCSLDYDKLSNNTNGYTIENLSDAVDRAVFNCLLRNESEMLLDISQVDFELALTESMPSNLKVVKSRQNFNNDWTDIGGMSEPKKILTEVFSWPLKYPDLLESSPLRLQRGVLLYGAPGTGKTLLAGALANKCGLNFISVKGPEILSKYVGASEEGVRSLFMQAQKTRPCLLFFDEFDSLAPKRGHDSSGVTDRVVNQMLTQLDGVESLHGVWVLAATSRPDLLDPALLRPGRLDKLVFCDFPNQEDRLSILEVLSKNLEKGHVNLLEIAEKTEGYTGADLQAILYNAQLSAIKDIKDSLEKTSGIKVEQHHFLRAFSEVKPSMSQMEKKRYERIYEKFLSSRKKNDPERYTGVQKVTLA